MRFYARTGNAHQVKLCRTALAHFLAQEADSCCTESAETETRQSQEATSQRSPCQEEDKMDNSFLLSQSQCSRVEASSSLPEQEEEEEESEEGMSSKAEERKSSGKVKLEIKQVQLSESLLCEVSKFIEAKLLPASKSDINPSFGIYDIQQTSAVWQEQRSIRCTASRFGEIACLKAATMPKRAFDMANPKDFSNSATKYGQNKEKLARQ